MRVAAKFILLVVVVLFAIRSVEGVLTVQRETEHLDATIHRDARLLARILSASVRSQWLENGREKAMNLLDEFRLDDHPVRISWKPFHGRGGLAAQFDESLLDELDKGQMASVREHLSERGEVQHFFVPLDIPDADGAIRLTVTLRDRSRYLRNALVREGIAGSIVVVAGGGTMLLLGFTVLGRPLRRLQERISSIGEGNLSGRVELKGRDELSTLAECLNDMCAKLAASRRREQAETKKLLAAVEQMRHMDRLTTIGRLASGVAHELGTPLNVITGRSGMLADGTVPCDPEPIRENARAIKSQADRMASIIRHLLDFARQRPPRRVATNGLDIARQAVSLVDCLGYRATISLEAEGEISSLETEMDPVQMQQVLTNLFDNAMQAMPQGGEVSVSVRSSHTQPPPGIDTGAGRFLQFVVEDSGVGIDRDNLPNVFDPFFTTKDVGKGTGLGLSIAYGIVREHGGWIDVASEAGKGSCFTVYIPQENQ